MKYLLLTFLILPLQLLTAQSLEALQKDDKYALFLNEERITEFIYDDVRPTADGGYMVVMSGACGLIDARGETTIPIQYDYLYPTGGNGYIAAQNGLAGVIDANENKLLPFVYEKVDQYSSSGTAVVKYNGRWSVLRSNGVASDDLSKVVFMNPDTYPVFAGNRRRGSARQNQQRSVNGILSFIAQEYLASPRVKREKIGGSATVSFVISAEGKVGAPFITDNDNVAFAEVLIGIIQRMPRWSAPALVSGQPVAMKLNLPINLAVQQ